MVRTLAVAALISLQTWAVSAEVTLKVGYLSVATQRPPTLSNLDPIPEDLGIAGAQTGLDDNVTTGKFLGHLYELETVHVSEDEDPVEAALALLANQPFLLLDAPAQIQTRIADLPEAQGALLFNTSSGAPDLRSNDCRANLFHSAASDPMRTDALAQIFVQKRWRDLVMITGIHPQDQQYADAMRRSIAKFGLTLEAEKSWVFDADMRRNAAQEVPLFTQESVSYTHLTLPTIYSV